MLRNLERAGFEGPVWGVNPKRDEVLGRACVPTVAELPEPVDAVVVAIPAAAVAGRGRRGRRARLRRRDRLLRRLRRGRGGPRARGRAARARARRRPAGLRPERQRGRRRRRARAALGRLASRRCSPGRVAMVSQSGNVAVNAIGSRRGIGFHTVVSTGNQAVLDASDWLAALARADGVRLGRAVPRVRRRRREARRGAGALRRARRRRRGAQGRRLARPGARGRRRAHRLARRRPARLSRAGRGGGRAPGRADPHELLELARRAGRAARAPARRRRVAVLTCSGGDSGLAADEATAARASSCPALAAGDRASARASCCPAAATIANPLDYTSMIWAETERLRRIVGGGRRRPGDRPAAALLRPPARALARGRASSGRLSARGSASGATSPTRRRSSPRRCPTCSTRRPPSSSRERGVPAVAGLRTAIACAAALGRPAARPGAAARDRRGRQRSRPRRAATGGWLDEAEAKRLLAGAGIAVPAGGEADDLDACLALAAPARLAGRR